MAISKIDEGSWGGTQIGGRRNLIINGAMQVSQRGTSWTSQTGNLYHLDRWQNQGTTSAVFSESQESSGAPEGFKYFQRVTVTTADATTDSADKTCIKQMIETQDLQHLKWGTANAEALTISFWVRSSISGTYSVAIYHETGTVYTYCASYTINAANTWEYKTITIAGNTNTGFTNSANATGMQIRFALATGSGLIGSTNAWVAGNKFGVTGQVQLTETVNSTFDLTGVQLEVGSVATPFEHRSYGEELALCQRYYQKSYAQGTNPATATLNGIKVTGGSAAAATTGAIEGSVDLASVMRTTPTLTAYDAAGTSARCSRLLTGTAYTDGQGILFINASDYSFQAYSSGGVNASNIRVHYTADAEL